MPSKYTLHYFNGAGRGEHIRIIFHHGGVEFTDKRYQGEDMKDIKADEKKFPLGQLPVLEVDGEYICQSHAISRYLANEFGLNGKTNKERVIIDQVLDALKNIEEKLWGAYFFKPTQEETDKQITEVFTGPAPRVFKLIETFLQRNNNGEGFLVGNTITLGDIHIVAAIETIQLDRNKLYTNFLGGYPLTKSLNERVRNSEKIKSYLASRATPLYPMMQ